MSLDDLLAKEAIRDVVLRYCRAVDRRDFEALKALYHEDATDDHGGMFCGSAADYIAWLPDMVSQMQVLSHQVLNHYIVVDGDEAEGEVYVQAYHLTKDEAGDDVEMIIGGRYLDRYSRRNGEWRFSARKIVMDWNQVQPSRCSFDDQVVAGAALGDSWDKDPSRDFFRLLRPAAG